jgi:hypothetical protein
LRRSSGLGAGVVLVAGWEGEVAGQHRPAGGMLVDQVLAGGVGVAGEGAGDRLEQDPALVGGVAVVVAVAAVKAALRGGAGDDRSGAHRWRLLVRDYAGEADFWVSSGGIGRSHTAIRVGLLGLIGTPGPPSCLAC